MTRAEGIGNPVDQVPAYAADDYAFAKPRRKIRRVKLGLLLASLAACLSVTLLGVVAIFIVGFGRGFDGPDLYAGRPGFVQGMQFGIILATYNFILFFITVPAAWIAMGLSIGRFPHRGISRRAPYLRWASIWGMILVGGTTGVFGIMLDGLATGAGSLLAGVIIGGMAGVLCGLLFHAIVKPAEQLHEADVSVF